MAYYIILPSGKTHTFYEGLTYEQVVAAAKNWGVDASGIQSTTGATPTPTTTPTTTTPTTTTPTTTTPTTTAPTTTTPTTTAPTGDYKDWSYLANAGANLERQIESWNQLKGTSFKFNKAGIEAYLDAINAAERTRSSILGMYEKYQEGMAAYDDYVADFAGKDGWPEPKDYADYLANFEQWYTEVPAQETERQREYQQWVRYARKYGGIDEWYPLDYDDWVAHYDKAQQQLAAWQQMAEETEVEYTSDQVREFNEWKRHASQFGGVSDWYPVDIADWLENYDQAQQQLDIWKRSAEEYDKYAVPPEEDARRREEAYQRSQYRQKEEFREAPMYSERFQQWVQGRGDMSGALQRYVEGKYPSLRAEFEAGLPRETGFETREAARAEAARREGGWQNWLSQRQPETEQEYWGQRPQERGERHYMQSPNLRAVGW